MVWRFEDPRRLPAWSAGANVGEHGHVHGDHFYLVAGGTGPLRKPEMLALGDRGCWKTSGLGF